MLDAEDIRTQAFLDSDTVTTRDAAQLARAESWAPHVEDGLDAFARVVHEAEAEKWAKVIAEAASNDSYRQKLAADPGGAVREFGIAVPPGVELRLAENTETVRYLVLPAPAPGGLAGEEVKALADGLATITRTTRLPQCWADTWVASIPRDPGRPADKPIETPVNKPQR